MLLTKLHDVSPEKAQKLKSIGDCSVADRGILCEILRNRVSGRSSFVQQTGKKNEIDFDHHVGKVGIKIPRSMRSVNTRSTFSGSPPLVTIIPSSMLSDMAFSVKLALEIKSCLPSAIAVLA